MTKTNGKYTYEDFLLRKRILKKDIKEIEKIAFFDSLPKTLGLVGGSIKNKTLELFNNPDAFNILVDTSVGIGTERFISRFVNKKSVTGQVLLLASTYLVPLAIGKISKLIVKSNKKNNTSAIDTHEIVPNTGIEIK